MQPDWGPGFDRVDRAPDPGACVHYLDAVSQLDFIKTYKAQSDRLLDVRPGHRLLEVGCGTGEDAQALARLVGETGWVVGVDSSATMIAEATTRARAARLPLEFRLGDAHQLEFGDQTFDGCRADRTFQHLADPARALAELVRVTKSAGRIVVYDPDWQTLVVDHPDRGITTKILTLWAETMQNGWMGRRLSGLFAESGLTSVGVLPLTQIVTDYPVAAEKSAFRTPSSGLGRRESSRRLRAPSGSRTSPSPTVAAASSAP